MPDCYDLKRAFISAYRDLLDFYQLLEKGSIVNPNGKPLVYRDEQYLYSEAIMKALLENKILILEAGVGTGKSIGYLLPIFFSMKNGKEVFKKVIISTSSIALQRQLKNDIKTVSKLLEFDIDVSISKGNGNYACYQEITNAMNRSSDNNTYKKLSEIRDYIMGLSSWDRDAMDSELVNPFWDSISLKSRTLCKECEIKQICPFYREQARIGQSNKPEIIILNNAKLSAALRQENSELITSADAIIIDEAHTLIPQMRLTGEGTINFANLERILNNYIIPKFYESFQPTKARDLISEFRQLNTDTIAPITGLQVSIRQSARTIFKDNGNNSGISMTSVDKLNINISDKDINTYAKKLGNAISKILIFFKKNHLDKEPLLKEYYDYLCVAVQVLMDMSKAKDSENVYWVNYNEDGSPFDLCFHEKSIQPYLDKLYKKRVILTSGTLSTARFDEKPYARTVKNLGLESNRRLEEGDPLETPYSFENCLLYHDPDMIAPPKSGDRTKYITALAEKVIELIKATHGKALILFTSKRDMKAVYDLVKLADLDVDLLLQNENNTNECVETFKENTNSCLFATGAFWEGIDVEGLALSNLIITKLPYPSDDPDIHAEKETLSEAEYAELLETEMILKLKQGFGRGKRSENDEVLYSILDPRFSRKINVLKSVLPTTLKYTTSMEEAQQYGQEHIVSKEKTLAA